MRLLVVDSLDWRSDDLGLRWWLKLRLESELEFQIVQDNQFEFLSNWCSFT